MINYVAGYLSYASALPFNSSYRNVVGSHVQLADGADNGMKLNGNDVLCATSS
jgi:hypothetical protein